MADLFISYSRKDMAFVRNLYDELAVRDFEAWVDWEGIAPCAEWLEEIYAAIDAAESFLFVISSNSVGSEICKQELAHAAQQNKRIIPVVHVDVAAKEVPEDLAKLNWIFFRANDDFDHAIERMIEAIKTDIVWVRNHTRLLVKSREWEGHKKNPSFLLRGTDLQTAEQWLSQGQDKEPKPTPLHTQYVIRSREATTRRNRMVMGGIGIGFIVALVLAVVAVLQRNEAVAQTKISNSRELSASAIAQLQVDPERSLLLAIQAAKIMPTHQAEDALRQSILASRVRAVLHGHGQRVNQACFSPDGKRIITAGFDGTARIWDAETGRLLKILSGHADKVTSAAFNADGSYVATGSNDGQARIWDVNTGQSLHVIRGHEKVVTSVAFNSRSDQLATGSADALARIYDLASRSVIQTLKQPGGRIQSVAFHPNGRHLLAAVGGRGGPCVWEIASGTIIAQLKGHYFNVYEAAFSADGTLVITAGEDKTARIWDWQSGGMQRSLLKHSSPVTGAAFDPNGRWVVTTCRAPANSAQLWNINSGQEILVLRGHTASVTSASFSPDGRRIITAGEDGTARIWDVGMVELGDDAGRTRMQSAAFSPDGKLAVTGDRTGIARIWDAHNGRHLKALHTSYRSLTDVGFSPDGKAVIVAGIINKTKSCTTIIDFKSGALKQPFCGHHGYVNSAEFSPDGGRILTASEDGTARIWDIHTGVVRHTLSGHEERVKSAAFNADGSLVVTAGLDGTARIWDAHTGIEKRTLTGHVRGVNRAAFSPDSKKVVTAGLDHIARIWNAGTGKLIIELRGHTDAVWDAAFSSDGNWIATGGDETARQWDALTGKAIAIDSGYNGRVVSTTFSPDSKHMIAASWGGTARITPVIVCCPFDKLVAIARKSVTRSLTVAERDRFLLVPR